MLQISRRSILVGSGASLLASGLGGCQTQQPGSGSFGQVAVAPAPSAPIPDGELVEEPIPARPSAVASAAYGPVSGERFPVPAAPLSRITEHLYAALTLIDRGVLSASTRGSMHGEIGQTQFLPKSILNYGTGGDLNNAANALTSTANFLRAHGWRAGGGYQPGEAKFGAIQAWNAAPVYQRAIAHIARQIDG